MKRNILILALSLAFALPTFAQVTLSGESNVFTSDDVNVAELDATWDVINTSGMTLNMTCKRVPVYEVPETKSQYCWGILCSAWSNGVLTLSEVVPLDNNQSTNTFHVKYAPYGHAGQSVFQYCYADDMHLIDEFCYEVNFCVASECIVGVENVKPSGTITQISPNPIERTGTLAYAFNTVPNAGKIVVHNMMGALVKEIQITNKNGVVILNAADFESGIYFCSIEDGGKVFETQRLVITK